MPETTVLPLKEVSWWGMCFCDRSDRSDMLGVRRQWSKQTNVLERMLENVCLKLRNQEHESELYVISPKLERRGARLLNETNMGVPDKGTVISTVLFIHLNPYNDLEEVGLSASFL